MYDKFKNGLLWHLPVAVQNGQGGSTSCVSLLNDSDISNMSTKLRKTVSICRGLPWNGVRRMSPE